MVPGSAFTPKANPNATIDNPQTGRPDFGAFPSIDRQGVKFAAGPIRLRYGEHRGSGRGFGFEHIWQARFPEVLTEAEARPLVAALISRILVSGAAIQHEYGTERHRKVTIVRTSEGIVVLQEMIDGTGECWYSIVTAIAKARGQGALIGKMP